MTSDHIRQTTHRFCRAGMDLAELMENAGRPCQMSTEEVLSAAAHISVCTEHRTVTTEAYARLNRPERFHPHKGWPCGHHAGQRTWASVHDRG